jgi:hypothetical protein
VLVVALVVVLVLLACAALLPIRRLPSWLNLYVGVAIASAVLVVLAALLA